MTVRDKASAGLSSEDLLRIVSTAEQVVQMYESALEILETAQSTIPAPTLEEVAEIRQGKWPLTQEAYLIGSFQRVILGAENVVSDLRAIDLETLRNLHEVRLGDVELNAIEEAVAERAEKGKKTREGEVRST
jgi:hypothetical protein